MAQQLIPELQAKLEEIRAARNFQVEDWIEKKCAMLNDYMRKCGLKACAVNVSGGVDSAVVLGLCKKAQSMANSPIQRVVGIAQPIHSTASIFERAYEAADALGAECITVNQTDLHNQLSKLVEDAISIPGEAFARGQLRSYMRTPVGYYVSQLISQSGLPCILMGTGNYDEDGYLMYFCKAGDGVVDVQLIADLHKSEVFAVGRVLGVPESILVAPPSADLWAGQTDEDELGFTYDFVYLYTEFLKMSDEQKEHFKAGLSSEAIKQFNELGNAADTVHRRNNHKANTPLNLNLLE